VGTEALAARRQGLSGTASLSQKFHAG